MSFVDLSINFLVVILSSLKIEENIFNVFALIILLPS